MSAIKPIFHDPAAPLDDKSSAEDVKAEADVYVHDDGRGAAEHDDGHQYSFWTRMGVTPESFKRRTLADKHNQLNKTLSGRHLSMIAIGGSIGAGLFVGSGRALRNGGPASLLLDFMIIGIMMINVVYALGEMALMYPISGGFYAYSSRFIDQNIGFAMGLNYAMQWLIVLPFEIVVAAEVIRFWDTTTSPAVYYTVFLVALVLVNIAGVLAYGEEEFWASFLKLVAISVFIVIGLILVLGGGPSNGKYTEYWGAREWYPNAFQNGFKGFCSVFITAAFSFAGTELVGLAAAESKTPLTTLPSATKQVFWRVTVFYILALLFVGLLVNARDERLFTGGGTFINTTASPFVIVAVDAGLRGFDSFINIVVVISVISIGNSGIYGASRTITALSEQKYLPGFFSYVDRAGRPLWSTLFVIAFGALAYIGVAPDGGQIFGWLLSLSGLSSLFSWGAICVAHIRFRMAWKKQGHTLDEIPFKAIFGIWGSVVGVVIVVLVLIAQFYVALYPISGNGALNTAEGFFADYLAFPVVLLFWFGAWAWKRGKWQSLDEIDLDSGRREIDWEAHHAALEKRKNASLPMRVYYFLF